MKILQQNVGNYCKFFFLQLLAKTPTKLYVKKNLLWANYYTTKKKEVLELQKSAIQIYGSTSRVVTRDDSFAAKFNQIFPAKLAVICFLLKNIKIMKNSPKN